jgi:hypothetical protein
MNDVDPPPYRGRVILLQEQQQQHDEGGAVLQECDDAAVDSSYRNAQILEADDDYSEFGTALAMSSYTNTLVVGIPRNIDMSTADPTVQVYYQTTTDNNTKFWETSHESPNESRDDMTGSWVAVAEDGTRQRVRIAYSARCYQQSGDPGDAALHGAAVVNDNVVTNVRQGDRLYLPTTGAVSL